MSSFKFPSLFSSSVKIAELKIFTRQLATLVDSGLSMLPSLDILKEQTPNLKLAEIIQDIKGSLEAGLQLSDAMARHPKVFDRMYVNLVAAGEEAGELDTVLLRLAKHMEKADKLRRQLRNTAIYPVAVLMVAIAVVILMLWKVIPIFQEMFKDYGYPLPGPTVFVINISNFVAGNIVFILAGIVLASAGYLFLMRWPKSRQVIDGILIRLPFTGNFVRTYAAAHCLGTLETMVSAGVPLVQSLETSAKATGNFVVRDALIYTREKILEGMDIHTPLIERDVFPPKAVQMIRVGATTDSLAKMLTKTSEFYEDEFDYLVGSMIKLFEPALYIILGVLCGGLMVAMYLPIFELAGAVKAR